MDEVSSRLSSTGGLAISAFLNAFPLAQAGSRDHQSARSSLIPSAFGTPPGRTCAGRLLIQHTRARSAVCVAFSR